MISSILARYVKNEKKRDVSSLSGNIKISYARLEHAVGVQDFFRKFLVYSTPGPQYCNWLVPELCSPFLSLILPFG